MKSLFDAIADRPRSHRIFLASAIVAIALGTVWSFVVGPALFEREEIQAEVISNNAFIAAKRAIASRLESAQKEASIAEVAAQRPQGNFRAPPEIDNLLEQVSAVAGEIGLDLELFQRKEERMRDFYAEVPTAVAISGGFHDIAVFIDRVSRL
jgi:type IV pilus assembly protein PilO